MYSEFYAYDFLGLSELEADFLQAMSSLNYAICASLDLAIHGLDRRELSRLPVLLWHHQRGADS